MTQHFLVNNTDTIRKSTITRCKYENSTFLFFCMILQNKFYYPDIRAAILMFTADFDVKEVGIFMHHVVSLSLPSSFHSNNPVLFYLHT